MADAKFTQLNENKIEKSLRNSTAFQQAFIKASKGEFDEDLNCATNMDLLKVTEVFTIHKQFNLETGKDQFKLYKEVFYIQDPHKYYFDEVEPTVYRRVSGQHEIYDDEDIAKRVAKRYNLAVIDDTVIDDKKKA